MEHITDLVRVAPMVQILDAPVPQTVDKLHDVLQFFDRLSSVPEPVIEVPKIYTEDVPMRAVLRATQLARTAGGSADDHLLFFGFVVAVASGVQAADRGAER